MRGAAESRRKLIFALALLSLLAPSARGALPTPALAADNPITIENQQTGSNSWELGSLVADDVSQQIKGYASSTSVLQGGSLSLYVTVNPAQTYGIDFYRMGWYGGKGGRLELHADALAGISQPSCPSDASTGLIACNWAPSYTMTIPTAWTSGVYMAVPPNGAQLLLHQAFLSVGHNEYWSNEMYNAAQAARDAGVNLAFFGANPVYWQVRYEASATGVANRVMVCYKNASIDPVQGPTTTVQWRNAPVNRPEQPLTGLMYTNETQGLVNVPYVVSNSSNWVYANTGFKDGDTVSNLVGYEADRYMANHPAAARTHAQPPHSP